MNKLGNRNAINNTRNQSMSKKDNLIKKEGEKAYYKQLKRTK